MLGLLYGNGVQLTEPSKVELCKTRLDIIYQTQLGQTLQSTYPVWVGHCTRLPNFIELGDPSLRLIQQLLVLRLQLMTQRWAVSG